MFKTFILGALIMTLAACEGESKEIEALQQRLCAGTAWPNAVEGGSQATPVHSRFAAACESIHLLESVTLEGAEQVYLCRSFVGNDPPPVPEMVADLPKHAAVVAAFGHDLMQDPILPVMRFIGMYFAAVIAADAQGQPVQVITTLSALKQQKVKLESVAAAAGWAYLQGALGEGYDTRALCKAQIAATEEGWIFQKADVFYNCQPRQWRTVTVSREGAVTVTHSEAQVEADGTSRALCID